MDAAHWKAVTVVLAGLALGCFVLAGLGMANRAPDWFWHVMVQGGFVFGLIMHLIDHYKGERMFRNWFRK